MLAAALALAAAGLVTGGVDAGATTTASRTLVPLVGTSAAPPTGATVLGPTATPVGELSVAGGLVKNLVR